MSNKHHFFIDYIDAKICIFAKNLEAKNPEKDTFLFEVMSYPYKYEYNKDAFYTFDEALKLAQDECDRLNKKEQDNE